MALDFTLPAELRDLLDRVRRRPGRPAVAMTKTFVSEAFGRIAAVHGESVQAACGEL